MVNHNDKISIVYAGNYGIFDGILISSLSLIKHTKSPVDVYILTMDLTEKNENFKKITEHQRAFLESVLKKSNENNRVIILDVLDLYRENLIDSPNAKSSYTPYALLRLLLHKIENVPSKILYLDADTVINNDIYSLWQTDIENYEFCGCLDYYGKIFMGYHYINTGVLLLNLDKIRKTELFEKCIKMLNKRRIFLPDQTALNRKSKYKKILERKYNEQKSYLRDDTVIQHFSKTIIWYPFFPFFYTKNIKPWQCELVKSELTRKYDDILDEYLSLKIQLNEVKHE